IDTWIGAKQKKDGVLPTGPSKDEEFLRRAYLDLTGTIPTSAEVLAFIADTTPDKRAKKIDQLLASTAFNDRWTMWFGDLVQNVQVANNSREYYLGRNVYYSWIRDSISSGKPYDQMVREALSGAGLNFTTGTANYVVRQMQNNGPIQDTYDNLAAHSAEKFLGIPMLCISCHSGAGHLETVNWYLRGKTRTDFWKMAAFFAQTQSRGQRYTDPANPNANILQFTVSTNPAGAYRLNMTDGNKSPRARNDAYVPYYVRHYPLRMMAEVVFDSMAIATNVPASFTVQGMSNVPMAMQMPDPLEGRRVTATTFINDFNRGDRDDTARSNDSSITQSLAMMNDQNVVTGIRRATANSTVSKVLASTTDPGTVTDQLYYATLSRKPN